MIRSTLAKTRTGQNKRTKKMHSRYWQRGPSPLPSDEARERNEANMAVLNSRAVRGALQTKRPLCIIIRNRCGHELQLCAQIRLDLGRCRLASFPSEPARASKEEKHASRDPNFWRICLWQLARHEIGILSKNRLKRIARPSELPLSFHR